MDEDSRLKFDLISLGDSWFDNYSDSLGTLFNKRVKNSVLFVAELMYSREYLQFTLGF